MKLQTLFVTALLATGATTHPGHDLNEEIATRRTFLEESPSNLDHCIDVHRASGLADRAIRRRGESAHRYYTNSGLYSEGLQQSSTYLPLDCL